MAARWEFMLLRLWHAALAGGFVVAYATADEDTYKMHVFAGYWVLVTLIVRLGLAVIGSADGPLRLPRPRLAIGRPGRNPAFAWMAAILLPALGLGAFSGVVADMVPAAEDLHEGLAEAGLALVLAHGAIIAWIFQGRRIRQALGAAVMLAMMAGVVPAQAADEVRQSILAAYAKEAGQPLSEARGREIYLSRNAATADLPSCATCHGTDPTVPGRHARTGRVIEPVAVSVNPKRFTDAAKVEERFGRDCQTVMGRACTALEKGDYLTFLSAR